MGGEMTTKSHQEQFGMKELDFVQAVSKTLRCSTASELSLVRNGLASVLLCSAAAIGNVEALQSLISDHNLHIDATDYDLRTALHVAASEGHEDLVRHLIGKGASVHSKDRFGNTPLSDAVRSRNK